MHGEGESWSFEADADVRAKFWGRSVELIPAGLIRLKFDDGDEYNWAKVGHIGCRSNTVLTGALAATGQAVCSGHHHCAIRLRHPQGCIAYYPNASEQQISFLYTAVPATSYSG